MQNSEINELVARKLGWNPEIQNEADGISFCNAVPPYATSIEAAFEIITDHCDEWHLDCRGTVTARLKKDYVEAETTEDTAPLAIAKAFLALP